MSGSGDIRRTFRLFRRFAGGQRWAYAVSGLLLAIEAAAAVGIPGVLGWIVDLLKEGKPFLTGKDKPPDLFIRPSVEGTIVFLALLMVAVDAVKILGDSLAEISLAKAGRSVGFNLRVALFGHLQKLSLAFHLRKRTGDVLARLTADVTAMEEFLVKSVSDLAGSVLLIVFTLSYMLYKSWEITLLAVIIMPLLASVSNWFAKRIKVASKDLRASEGDLASSAQEMLTSISVVQTYGRSAYEERRFAEQSHSAMNSVMRTARLEAGFGFTVGLMQSGVLAAVIYLGGVVLTPGISTGTVVAFVLLMDQMFKPTKRIIKEWNTVSKLYASVERINDLFGREPAVQEAPDAVVTPPLRGQIEFRDVSFAYQAGMGEDSDDGPTRLALDSMSFTIAPGEVVALVGHSGAGKSTIAQLLPRLYDPHAGAVLVDGIDVRRVTMESLRAQIGMLMQEAVLFSGTIAENIGYGREGATREEIVAAARQANAHDFISELSEGYDTVLGERAATLSGGQRQRLSIARAFVRGAPILVLDEPTTGLDAESTDLVMQGLMSLLRGKTAIIISHDFRLMEIADRMLVLSAGRILEEGTGADLLARGGLYAELHARQFGAVAATVPPLEEVARDGPVSVPGGDGERVPARRAFETVLMQAVPLPASPEAFQILTGHPPPVVQRDRLDERQIPTQPGADARHRAPAGPVDDLDPWQSRALGQALPGLAESLDAAAMAPRLAQMLAEGWTLEWCSPGKALVEPGEGATVRYQVGLRDPASGDVVKRTVGGRMFLDADAADDWLRGRLAPLADRAAGRADLAAFGRTVDGVPSLRLALHAFPLDPELPGLLDATDPNGLLRTLGETLANRVEGLVLQGCQPHVVQYARRGRCVLRYELRWSLGGTDRTLKQVVYGKVYADDQGATVGPAVSSVRALLESRPGPRFLVPRFQGYLPDLRLALLEALPGTPQVAHLVRDRVMGAAPQAGHALDAALDTCAGIAATLHSGSDGSGTTRTLAGELAAVRSDLAAVEHYAPALVATLEAGLAELDAAPPDVPGDHGSAHGDLTPSQVLFDGPLSGLVDFDTATVAEPALDLGQFTGYLALAVRKAQVAASRGSGDGLGAADAFLLAYLRAADVADPGWLRERTATFRTVSLTRVAVRSWRQLKPARLQLALSLLEARRAAGTGARS